MNYETIWPILLLGLCLWVGLVLLNLTAEIRTCVVRLWVGSLGSQYTPANTEYS